MSALAEKLRCVLANEPGDPPLAGDDIELAPAARLVPAAVLIAITDADQPRMILTVRREHLRTHAGQIAFPGGRIDPGEDAIAAALREAEEEIGLQRRLVAIAGQLAAYRTVTSYSVIPVVGIVPTGLDLAPHEAEVERIFQVPLDVVLDPSRHVSRSALFQGRKRLYYEIEWEGHRIWGATAAMIINLAARLQWP